MTLALTHLVAQPRVKRDERPPLLLLLHGVGSNEHDLFALAPYVDERLLVVSARAPRKYVAGGFSWFDIYWHAQGFDVNVEQAIESWHTVQRFIGELVETYQADPQRVYVAGFSQGAAMTLGTALTRPDLVAGTMVISGRWTNSHELDVNPESLNGKPFLVMHGTRDEIVPISYGREIRDHLQTLPVNLTYHEYPMGHEISMESLRDGVAWLGEQLG